MQPSSQMDAFRLALDSNGLSDLGWRNKKFTWSNRHHDDNFIRERLDHTIANRQWINKFGCSGVEVLTVARSDHQPIVLAIWGHYLSQPTKSSVFLFEASWAIDEEGEDIIQSTWQQEARALNCWAKVHAKLLQYSIELVKWRARKRRDFQQDLET